ncbi:MAG TPA: hypothetical protein VGM77_07410 [Gemmatimonadales bacterium]|jgi:hypothetical protein
MTDLTHYIPILTTSFACWFAPQLYLRWRDRRPAPHLLWWFIGVLTFAAGTITESWTTLLGWNPAVFRAWYITGALLGGAPLAQGTAYLLLGRRTANMITAVLVTLVVVASIGVVLSPLNLALVQPHRLSGSVLVWAWVRYFSPFINVYALLMLVGGALVSAQRYYFDKPDADKVKGNIAIAIGALLPGIGGTATRFGHVEVLYVTEFLGLVLIYCGFRLNTGHRIAGKREPVTAAISRGP